jgi:acyl-CoA reductase-like NAD-dependent aldehyde dehydrogenase
MIGDPRVDFVAFTGSVAGGHAVTRAASGRFAGLGLELGGKDPAYVRADADINHAVENLVDGSYFNSGQSCCAIERIYVHRDVHDAFLDGFVALTKQYVLGNPLNPETTLGPLVRTRAADFVRAQVGEAVAHGARGLIDEFTFPESRPGTPYLAPQVLINVDHSMRVMREETFGPVLPIMAVADAEEALRLANDSEYGLTASIWTRDPEKAERLRGRLQAGVVTINDCVYSYGEPTAPWGGYKKSGIGRTHGLAGLREMVQVKYVASEMSRGRALWWFPYGEEFRLLMSGTNRLLHGGLRARLLSALRLMGSRRFWSRARLLDLLRNIDRAF